MLVILINKTISYIAQQLKICIQLVNPEKNWYKNNNINLLIVEGGK